MWGNTLKSWLLGLKRKSWESISAGIPWRSMSRLEKHITRTTADFMIDEETGEMNVRDQERVTVGGMIDRKEDQIYQK